MCVMLALSILICDIIASCTPIILGGDNNKDITKDKYNGPMYINDKLSLY